jgi:hypothetical protein
MSQGAEPDIAPGAPPAAQSVSNRRTENDFDGLPADRKRFMQEIRA